MNKSDGYSRDSYDGFPQMKIYRNTFYDTRSKDFKNPTGRIGPTDPNNSGDSIVNTVLQSIQSKLGPVVPMGESKGTQLRGIQAQLVGSGSQAVEDGENVIFDTVLNNQGTDISYNTSTGEFTIKQPGNYSVAWWVAIDGTGLVDEVYFSLRINGSGDIISTSPSVTGQISGNAFITLPSTPAILKLVNTSNDKVILSGLAVQANIVITKVTV